MNEDWFLRVQTRAYALESKYAQRDERMRSVQLARQGRLQDLLPQFFSEDMPYAMVSNFIDTVARDLAEAVGPLPALNCSSGRFTSDKARLFNEKRAKIGINYWRESNLAITMFKAADQYFTYGFSTFIVEPDVDKGSPRIRLLDPFGTYPEFDLDGNVTTLLRRWTSTAGDLIAQYGSRAMGLINSTANENTSSQKPVTVFRYIDKSRYVVWAQSGLGFDTKQVLLSEAANPTGRVPVVVALRPSHDSEMRGQFDDVLGVQAARAILMRLMVEATEKQVQAPLAVPDDVADIPVGADAIIRSANPRDIHHVDLSVGTEGFQQIAGLQQELLSGSRYPGARNGQMTGSVITGRGVEALMGGFDSQIKTAQTIFADALMKLTGHCFELDEKMFPDIIKQITGVSEGTPFEITYNPGKDINGAYMCDVTYGFLAGMDPNRALVFMLQLRGDRLIDRETVQRHMPFDVDVNQLQQNIDQEELRDGLMQGFLAYVQAIGPMASQGMDPSPILKIAAETVKGRAQGKPLEDLLSDAFAQIEKDKQAAAQAAQEAQAQAASTGQPGGAPDSQGAPQPDAAVDGSTPGVGSDGLPTGVASGQAGMGVGGRPSVQMLMASMGANGNPELRAGVRKILPG